MIGDYFLILGVDKNTSLADIKKAYRRKAKLYHPDINQSPDAQEKFISINEAYEYLHNLKTGSVYSQKNHSYVKPEGRQTTYQDWQENERQKARQRARKHAEMHYDAFTKTSFYKTTVSLNVIADFISVFTVLFIFIGAPLIGFITKGLLGMFGGILIIIVTVPYWADVVVNTLPKLNYKELKPAIIRVANTRTFQLIIAIGINLFLFFRIGLSTLIPLWTLGIVFAVAIIVGYLVSTRQQDKFYKRLTVWGVAPGLVNLFLLLNFLITTNQTTETYLFTQEVQRMRSRMQKTTHITLEGDRYADFVGIRIFADYVEMEKSREITYNFADGIFGLRVMKSYEFIRR